MTSNYISAHSGHYLMEVKASTAFDLHVKSVKMQSPDPVDISPLFSQTQACKLHLVIIGAASGTKTP